MYPHERSLVEKLADKPFAIVGVNSDPDLEALKPVLEKEEITWRSFWNGPDGTQGPISKAWNVRGWPTTYLIDAKGTIRFKQPRGAALNRGIVELLAEIGHEVDLLAGIADMNSEDADAEDVDADAEDDPGDEDMDTEGADADGGDPEDAEEAGDGDMDDEDASEGTDSEDDTKESEEMKSSDDTNGE